MLPIHEQFYSFQGEGAHAGKAAFFIRTFGCPVHCPWCDSAGTWHPDHVPERVDRIEVDALAAAASPTRAEFVVVTGGEPTIHNLEPLVNALHSANLKVHLETSGAFPIHGNFDWITLSPKRWRLPLPENITKADEFKIIVDSQQAIKEYTDLILANGDALSPLSSDPSIQRAGIHPEPRAIWLHPEWSQAGNRDILNHITDWIKQHGFPYRAGWQLHKNFGADLLDGRSAPAAPLGGDQSKGY
jgi:organic radical activating enzyme